jgi:hypothetical protein
MKICRYVNMQSNPTLYGIIAAIQVAMQKGSILHKKIEIPTILKKLSVKPFYYLRTALSNTRALHSSVTNSVRHVEVHIV